MPLHPGLVVLNVSPSERTFFHKSCQFSFTDSQKISDVTAPFSPRKCGGEGDGRRRGGARLSLGDGGRKFILGTEFVNDEGDGRRRGRARLSLGDGGRKFILGTEFVNDEGDGRGREVTQRGASVPGEWRMEVYIRG